MRDLRDSECRVAGFLGYRDGTVKAADGPYRSQKAEDESEPGRPSRQIGPASERELRGVELRSPSDW